MYEVLVQSPPVPIGVVVNPNSKQNRRRGGRRPREEELQAIVGEHGVVCATTSLEALGSVVRTLLERRVRYLVSDGGDGTLHCLLNEVFRAVERRGGRMPAILPSWGGTINFVARRVGIDAPADLLLEALVRAEVEDRLPPRETIGTLRLRGRYLSGEPLDRLGFCAALAGVGQRFFEKYYQEEAPGPGTIAKVIARGLLSMPWNVPGLRRIAPGWGSYVRDLAEPTRAEVHVDGERLDGERWRAINVGAISANLGGVARLFPLAERGRLHVILGNPSLSQIARAVPSLLRGAPLGRGLEDREASRLEVRAADDAPLRPVIDGEQLDPVVELEVTRGPALSVPVPT